MTCVDLAMSISMLAQQCVPLFSHLSSCTKGIINAPCAWLVGERSEEGRKLAVLSFVPPDTFGACAQDTQINPASTSCR